jgi:subfamily B ATP-binding cassette protein MsbA
LRYFEIFDQEPDIRSPENALVFPGLKEKIVFENVSFSYDGKNKALDNINLAIKKGEVIALVGASGGGKTTLTNMIPRFYDPTEGRILFDEFDLRQLELSSLRRSIGIVTQETMLFHDTVFNNIAFGSPETPREKVGTVAKFANAHDFILALPQGYETIIGERGSRLSGGQRQRLAIARAIINDPEILIFDEATSSLDSEAEKQIQEALEKIIIGRTVIIIAHRLSTVRFAHRILVIENGKIAEEGVHSELMAKNGSYRKLYDLQYWVNDKTSL